MRISKQYRFMIKNRRRSFRLQAVRILSVASVFPFVVTLPQGTNNDYESQIETLISYCFPLNRIRRNRRSSQQNDDTEELLSESQVPSQQGQSRPGLFSRIFKRKSSAARASEEQGQTATSKSRSKRVPFQFFGSRKNSSTEAFDNAQANHLCASSAFLLRCGLPENVLPLLRLQNKSAEAPSDRADRLVRLEEWADREKEWVKSQKGKSFLSSLARFGNFEEVYTIAKKVYGGLSELNESGAVLTKAVLFQGFSNAHGTPDQTFIELFMPFRWA